MVTDYLDMKYSPVGSSFTQVSLTPFLFLNYEPKILNPNNLFSYMGQVLYGINQIINLTHLALTKIRYLIINHQLVHSS